MPPKKNLEGGALVIGVRWTGMPKAVKQYVDPSSNAGVDIINLQNSMILKVLPKCCMWCINLI